MTITTIRNYISILIAIIIFPLALHAQKIVYSDVDRDDVRSVDFDIIGKLNNHYLVYKRIHSTYNVAVYDNDMKLADKVKMSFLPDRLINSDIITYKDFFYFIYQYQKRNIVYCMAAHMNSDGKITGDPVTLDTTAISFFASNKIYNVIYSEDKQRICVYKINSKDESKYIFTSSIFDGSLKPLSKKVSTIAMQHNDFLTEFSLDNDGGMAFVKASGSAANSDDGTIQNVTLMVRPFGLDSLKTYPVNMPKIYLDDIRIKVDNINKHILIAAFFATQKRGNIEGLYCILWGRDADSLITAKEFVFNDQLKSNAKSEGSTRAAFNDYYLQNIIMRKDGGFAVLSESAYSSNRGIYNNRWNNIYGNPYWGSSNYYLYGNPFGYTYYPWMSPYGYGYPNQVTRYFADNIAVISFDSVADMEWAHIIPKSQYDDNSDNFIGYGTFITSGKINFLFNQFQKRTLLLQAESIDPQGKAVEAPTLRELDKGYQFMPRYVKQVSSREVVIPCQYRNYLCFAKIEF